MKKITVLIAILAVIILILACLAAVLLMPESFTKKIGEQIEIIIVNEKNIGEEKAANKTTIIIDNNAEQQKQPATGKEENDAKETDDSSAEKQKTPEGTNEIIDEVVQPAEQFFTDWNKDGAEDLVRKELDGKYYVFPNYGTNENPVYNESYAYEKN